MEVSAETADLVVREGVQLSEQAIRLLASGAKNLAALLYALAKDQKKLYGKVSMNRLCRKGVRCKSSHCAQRIWMNSRNARKKSGCCLPLFRTKAAAAPVLT